MSWFVHAVPLPDGDRPVDLWVDRGGCLVREPVAGAEQLPGHYVVPGLVDAHAHPTVPGRPAARSQWTVLRPSMCWPSGPPLGCA
jgi:imidazolonepropionase-like amidohydrolase